MCAETHVHCVAGHANQEMQQQEREQEDSERKVWTTARHTMAEMHNMRSCQQHREPTAGKIADFEEVWRTMRM